MYQLLPPKHTPTPPKQQPQCHTARILYHPPSTKEKPVPHNVPLTPLPNSKLTYIKRPPQATPQQRRTVKPMYTQPIPPTPTILQAYYDWHLNLGHISATKLHYMAKNTLAKGLPPALRKPPPSLRFKVVPQGNRPLLPTSAPSVTPPPEHTYTATCVDQ